jgi:hypothetical protein
MPVVMGCSAIAASDRTHPVPLVMGRAAWRVALRSKERTNDDDRE